MDTVLEPFLSRHRVAARRLLLGHPEPRDLDHPAHLRGDGGPAAADREADAIDDRDAAHPARDQEDPAAVQGRPPEAERRADEVLPREQRQPALGCLPVIVADAGDVRPLPGAARHPGPHPDDRRVQRPLRCHLRNGDDGRVHAAPRASYFLGMDLMVSPANSGSASRANFIERLPYFIAVAAVVASGWYQMWQTQRRQKRLGTNQNNPINKQMQMITRVFPIVFGWFSWIASSGLVAVLRDEQPVADRPAAPRAQQVLRGRTPTKPARAQEVRESTGDETGDHRIRTRADRRGVLRTRRARDRRTRRATPSKKKRKRRR